jgi:hypothetical protein
MDFAETAEEVSWQILMLQQDIARKGERSAYQLEL